MSTPAWLTRLLARPWMVHVIAAVKRFSERLGWQFAAAMTYFSFLAVVPIIMVGFSIAGFVLLSHHSWLVDLRQLVAAQFPAKLASPINQALDDAVGSRLSVGLVGLVVAVYSGQSWMGNLRSALQAQWRADFDDEQEIAAEPLWHYYLKNVRYLTTLSLGIVLSLVLTAVGSNAPQLILRWLGLPEYRVLTILFTALPLLLAVVTDTGIFFWIYAVLSPRKAPVARRYVFRGALFAAIAFEILKILVTVFANLLLGSVTGKIFGPVIGLLLFFYLTATVMLFTAAWIATSAGARPTVPAAAPVPVVPGEVAVTVRRGRPRLATFSAGVLVGLLARRRRR